MPDETPVAGIPAAEMAPIINNSPAQTPASTPAATPATPSAIDWSKIDPSSIPESIVKQTKQFADVLSESVERRQQIKQLKAQVENLDQPKKADLKPDAKQDAGEPEWAKALRQELETLKADKAKSELKPLIAEAIKEFNLPDSSSKWLTGATKEDIRAQAAELAQTFLIPGAGGAAGGGSVLSDKDRITAAIEKKITRQQGPIDPVDGSFFNPATQDRVR